MKKDDDLSPRRSAPYQKWRPVFIFLGAGLVAIPAAVHYVEPSSPFYHAAFLLFAAGLIWGMFFLVETALFGSGVTCGEEIRALPKSPRWGFALTYVVPGIVSFLTIYLMRMLPEPIWVWIAVACQRLGFDQSPEFYVKWLPYDFVILAELLWGCISLLMGRRKSQRTS